MKIKHSEIAGVRKKLLEEQNNRCAICCCSFDEAYYNHKKRKTLPKHTPCLDHCHRTGKIRAVLCSGCNSLEGKVINAIERWHTAIDSYDDDEVAVVLISLAQYYEKQKLEFSNQIHPSFKDDEEKRVLRNKRARLRKKKS